MDIISTADFIELYRHVNFKKLAKKSSGSKVSLRLLGLWHLINGKNRKEAGECVGRSDEWIRKCVLDYHNGGIENLVDKPKTGQPAFISKKQEQELVSDILQMQDERNGGRITAKDIMLHVNAKFKVNYKLKSIYDLLERIGMSWVSSRSKHPQSDPQKQKNFKKTFKARVAKIKKQQLKKKKK
jgi:transposase